MPVQLKKPDLTSGLSDRDLLRRFVQDADEAAFTEIVKRHQGLVLGVCRRVIGSHPDVDDAFQATFITLARRPRQIKKTASLSSWLYTVAWRTSWRMVKKRRKHPVEPLSNQPLAEPDDPLQKIASAQDCLVLDEELNGLPAKYKEVLVMTYFSSQTSQQIADQLSVSKGTIDGRIREARNQLRVRLARRGVAIGALAVAAGLSTGKSAVASTTLLESTIQLGAQTLSSSVPGTTDLSHLEPFIHAETAMISTKTILTGLFCTSIVAGIMGMNGLQQDGATGQNSTAGEPSAKVEATVEAPKQVEPEVVELFVANPQPTTKEKQEDRLVEIYFLEKMNAGSAEKTLQDLFDSDGSNIKIVADIKLNTLMVLGTVDQHSQIKKVLGDLGEGLDKPAAGAGTQLAGTGEPQFKSYPQDARPVEVWMHKMLKTPVPLLDFPGETPLSEILERIATHYTTKHGQSDGDNHFRLTVMPDITALELEGITTLDEVFIQDLNLEGATLENTLQIIFEQTDLTYEIRNEVMVITSQEKASQSMVTRVYQVGHLTNLKFQEHVYPMNGMGGGGYGGGGLGGGGFGGGGGQFSVQFGGGGMGGGGLGGGPGMSPGKKQSARKAKASKEPEEDRVYVETETLQSLIMEMTSPPCQWMNIDGEGGAIQPIGDTLVIRQTQQGHREIVRLLNLLTESTKKTSDSE